MSFYSKFAASYRMVFPFREAVYRFLRDYSGQAGEAVLDVGCGPGDYCGRFAHDGYRATGIDLDAAMISDAVKSYPEARFHCRNMLELKAVGSGFRCIYSVGNVLAHLPQSDLMAFIETVRDMLDPGGCWIMQVMNWDSLLKLPEYVFPVKSIPDAPDPLVFHRSYSSISPDSAIFTFSLFRAADMLFTEQIKLYPVSSGDYRRFHEDAGFRCLAMFADFRQSALSDEPGTGLVMVFQKNHHESTDTHF